MAQHTPLAARMRPRTLKEVMGQEHLLGMDGPLTKALDQGHLPSLLLWGPPGCGKTSLARLLADQVGMHFATLSAVTSGAKDLREVTRQAKAKQGGDGAPSLFQTDAPKGTLLFVDEIHRWNKAQQDALLPHVEEGVVTLVGATTENPAFQVISPLRSRCWLLQLQPLSEAALATLARQALTDTQRGLGSLNLTVDDHAIASLAQAGNGDARRCLSILERWASLSGADSCLTTEGLAQVLGATDTLHDRDGDAHYDIVSALIKSLRGSDPDAALYWMARMLEGGEDPMFIARRLMVFASEDVGNAEPRALQLAVSTMQAVHFLGMPEGRIALGQACTFLATAPKSNAAYKAIDAALMAVKSNPPYAVPHHLRNAPTDLAKTLGHGAEYKYPHDYPGHIVDQEHLPPEMGQARFYHPTDLGAERVIRERLAWWNQKKKEK